LSAARGELTPNAGAPRVAVAACCLRSSIADGNHIVILVKGNKVVDYVDRANTYTTGHLALQHNKRDGGSDTVVQFRRIEVRELPTERP
jgi:hypothetical protein